MLDELLNQTLRGDDNHPTSKNIFDKELRQIGPIPPNDTEILAVGGISVESLRKVASKELKLYAGVKCVYKNFSSEVCITQQIVEIILPSKVRDMDAREICDLETDSVFVRVLGEHNIAT